MKTIFLDIDGTLIADKGIIPQSAIDSIRQARGNGHQVVLCTGRAMSEVHPEILDIGFDGIVACGGNFVSTFDSILYQRYLTREELMEIYDFLESNRIDFFAESNQGLFPSKHCVTHLKQIMHRTSKDPSTHAISVFLERFIHILKKDAPMMREDISKITFLESDVEFRYLQSRFADRYELFEQVVEFFGRNSGEISILGTDKTVGMELILKHWNASQENTVAIGDGNNDLKMLGYAQIGVAMGNATDRLKEIADLITTDVAEDGIKNAFLTLGLI